jgi:hypothetical protein
MTLLYALTNPAALANLQHGVNVSSIYTARFHANAFRLWSLGNLVVERLRPRAWFVSRRIICGAYCVCLRDACRVRIYAGWGWRQRATGRLG